MDSIFLILFFLTFTAITLRDIRYGVYAVIFSMPLYLVRFSIGGIPTTVLEIMIYILFLVWVLNKFEILKYFHTLGCGSIYLDKIKKDNSGNNILLIGTILLFLGLTISTFNSTDLRISLGILKGWFIDPFLFFIVFVSAIKKNKHIILSLKSWIFSSVAVSSISIFYLLNNELTFDGRLKAFFLSPNHLAMYLAPAFLIALFFLLNRRNLNRKVFSIEYLVLSVFLLIISIPLFFTYSYGAFLGVFAGAVYLLAVGNDKKSRLSFTHFRSPTPKLRSRTPKMLTFKFFSDKLLLIILLSFLFVGFIFITSNKFDQIINSSNRSSFHSRLMIWNSAGEIIKDNPLFGIGPGTFQETYLSYAEKFDEPYLEWAVPQPHNVFLAFYLQTGFVGFVGFVLILIWFFNRRNRAMPCFYNIINALMIYILIHGLVDTTYWKNDLALMFWLIIGMMFVKNLAIDPVRNFTKKYTENKLS